MGDYAPEVLLPPPAGVKITMKETLKLNLKPSAANDIPYTYLRNGNTPENSELFTAALQPLSPTDLDFVGYCLDTLDELDNLVRSPEGVRYVRDCLNKMLVAYHARGVSMETR